MAKGTENKRLNGLYSNDRSDGKFDKFEGGGVKETKQNTKQDKEDLHIKQTIITDMVKIREEFVINGIRLKRGPLEEPLWLGFKLLFEFNEKSPLLYIPSNPDDPETFYSMSNNSAYMFLKHVVKDDARAELLRYFISELKYISQESYWYFQKISGLNDIFNFDFTQAGKTWGKNETSKITIDTLETLDMRITSLLRCLRLVVLDTTFRRLILPKNLQWFSVLVYIEHFHEYQVAIENQKNINKDRDSKQLTVTQKDDEFYQSNGVHFVNEKGAKIIFGLNDCTFDLYASDFGNDIDNSIAGEATSNKLVFSYSDVEELDFFPTGLRITSKPEYSIAPSQRPDYSSMFPENPMGSNYSTNGTTNKTPTSDEPTVLGDTRNPVDVFTNKIVDNLQSFKRQKERSLRTLKGSITTANEDLNAGRLPFNKGINKFIENTLDSVQTVAEDFINNRIERALLGNVYEPTVISTTAKAINILQNNSSITPFSF